jgi:hypothetical protein
MEGGICAEAPTALAPDEQQKHAHRSAASRRHQQRRRERCSSTKAAATSELIQRPPTPAFRAREQREATGRDYSSASEVAPSSDACPLGGIGSWYGSLSAPRTDAYRHGLANLGRVRHLGNTPPFRGRPDARFSRPARQSRPRRCRPPTAPQRSTGPTSASLLARLALPSRSHIGLIGQQPWRRVRRRSTHRPLNTAWPMSRAA